MNPGPRFGSTAQVVLAVLAVIAALFYLKPIIIPVALALLFACLLAPVITLLKRVFRLGPVGAAVLLFVLTVMVGLYGASLTAESLIRVAQALPGDIEALSRQISTRINDATRSQPYLRSLLPDPGTIDRLGDANQSLLINKLSAGFVDLSYWVAQGFIVAVLVLFLLAESDMLTPKVIRFFAESPGHAQAGTETLTRITRQMRAYLVARAVINFVLGVVIGVALWLLDVRFAVPLGVFAAVTNFIPYIGPIIGGALPTLITFGHSGSVGDALLVAAVYLAVVTVEGYVVTPYVMGRSLDLNGTTVLIACLFWGFLWGLMGLVLAMPITVSMKLIFQTVPELNRWAELMSRDWQTPAAEPASAPMHGGSLTTADRPQFSTPHAGDVAPVRDPDAG